MESLAGAGSQKMNVLTGVLSNLQIGSTNFTNMPVVIADLSSLQTVYNTTVDGILGYYFIYKGRVTINFKTIELTMYFYQQ